MFIKFDENGNFLSYAEVESINDIRPDPTGFEKLEYNVSPNDIYYLRKVNGVISIDETAKAAAQAKSTAQKRIAELKALLTASDYKIIKCMEAQLTGAAMPYDYAALIAERDGYRAEINELEGK